MTYTIETPTCRKDNWGKWTAKTAIVFDGVTMDNMNRPTQLVLNITTYKTDRGILLTNASAVHRGDHFESHSFGLAGGGDFSKRIFANPVKMVNEKRILAQHAEAAALIPALVAEAEAYYAAEDAKEAARPIPQPFDGYPIVKSVQGDTNRPGDQAASFAEETGLDYATSARLCNMD